MPTDARSARSTPPPPQPGRSWLDPGWLLLLSGLALIAATLILPAQAELRQARIDRDVAKALHAWRQAHLENHRVLAQRLESPDDPLLISLVSTQLNMIPASSQAVPLPNGDAWTGVPGASDEADASPFPSLAPVYQPPIVEEPFQSILVKWTANPRTRLYLMAAGVLMAFLGVVACSSGRDGDTPAED